MNICEYVSMYGCVFVYSCIIYLYSEYIALFSLYVYLIPMYPPHTTHTHIHTPL